MKRHLTINAARRSDPTRTTRIRASFVAQVRRRWNLLKRDIAKSIVERDVFGIQPGLLAFNEPAQRKQFDFPRSEDKVKAFMDWLEEQERLGILEVTRRPGSRLVAEEAWSNVYIRSAYQRGIARARTELHKSGYAVSGVDSVPGGVSGMMNSGFHADRVGLIYTRTFEDLKTVTQVTNARIRRALADGLTTELAQGIAEGRHPRQIARSILNNVNGAIEKIGKTRAEMIARTEVIRAHTAATIIEYKQAAGDIDVVVEAEVSTAGFNVCPICEGYAQLGPISLERAEALIPAHPNCYGPGTEIYTGDGFVPIETVKVGDRCLSLNPTTFNLEYVQVVDTVSRHESGELLHFTSRDFDMLVTKDHQMFTLRRERAYTNARHWEFIDAAKVPTESRFYRSSKWVGDDTDRVMIGSSAIEAPLFAEFMGWWLAEGSFNGKSIVIAQSKTANPGKYEWITEVCESLGDTRHRSGCIALFHADLRAYLSQFGRAHEKFVPREVKDLSPRLIRRFLDAYAAGDGHVRASRKWKAGNFGDEIIYTTSSKRMADDLGELVLKVGRRPSYYLQRNAGKSVKHHNGTYVGNVDIWRISECRGQTAQLGNVKRKPVKYVGPVHCVTLARNHTLWIRSKGKTAWGGNCRCAILPVIKRNEVELREAA